MYITMTRCLKLSSRLAVAAIGVFLCANPGFSQINLQEYKQKYSGNHIVQLNRSETVKMDVLNDQFKISITSDEDFLLLNSEAVSLFSEEEIDFSSFETISNIDAYSYNSADKKKQKIKATSFSTKTAEKEDHIFHDDMKTLSFFYPSLKEGSVKHLSYVTDYKEHRFPMGYRFFSYYPLEKSVFIIDHDTSIHLLRYDYNMEGFEIDFKETIVKNRRIWTWTCTKVPSYRKDSYSPMPTYFLPGTYCQISHYYSKGKKVNVMGSLDDLVSWYAENVQNVLTETPSDNLITTTKSIVAGIDDDFEKVKAIYYWVQDHIKYIAFEEGVEGFIPRMPNQICEKRYGDCKDMSVLIYKMLEIANVKGKIAWVGTNYIPFKYSVFPSSAVDDHMIAVYETKDKTYFLDATSELQMIDVPSYAIQGKEALIFGSRNDYRVEQIVTPDEKKSTYLNTTRIEISNRKIIGEAKQTVTGYSNWITRSNLSYMADLSDDKKVEKFRNLGNNSYRVTKSKIQIPTDRAESVVVDYSFEAENYVTSFEDEVFINLVLDKEIYKEKQLKSTRKSPFMMDYYSDNYYVTELVIPKGMKIKSLPESMEYITDKLEFKIEYEVIDGIVRMKMNTVFKFLFLQPNEFQIWNNFVSTVDKALASSLVLEKEK
jgi:hypothetical protein